MGGGNSKNRVIGLDLLRVLAIVCVIGGHYFINTDFNKTPFDNPMMFVLGLFQTFTLIGVPLFLMLTGYLNLNKTEPTRSYYNGIWKVLIAYLFFSIVTILFRIHYLGQEKSVMQWVHSILSFDAIPYAWYIEMWIGLFLLTPFLNRLWHSIETKRHRQILIAILFASSAIPDLLNRYGMHLVPGYWVNAAYPLLCFYLGSYIRTYSPTFKAMTLIGLITGLCLINPVMSILIAKGQPMTHLHGGPGGVVSISIAILSFLLFYQRDIKAQIIRGLITKISILSLNMYLVAALFDMLLYPVWYDFIGTEQKALAPFYLLIVTSLLTGTLLTSWAYDFINFKARSFIQGIKNFPSLQQLN